MQKTYIVRLTNGEQEAQVIALRLSNPPEGRNGWTLQLLADKVVELQIVPAISPQTIRRMLKKITSPVRR